MINKHKENKSPIITVEEKVTRQVISCFRSKLDWVLHIPEWEGLFREGLDVLDLPVPRQGIGLKAVLNSLLIEQKVKLITWSLVANKYHFSSQKALKLCHDYGLDLFPARELDEYLTNQQWSCFRDKFKFALNQEYQIYKAAQTRLFVRYRKVVDKLVGRIVFDVQKHADALQEGYLGLLHAIDKVTDTDRSFGSYAYSWALRYIKNFLMQERFVVHVPVNLASRILSEVSDASSFQDSPNTVHLKEDQAKAVMYDRLRQASLSLDEVQEETGQEITAAEEKDPLQSLVCKDLQDFLMSVTDSLTTKQREVLFMRFGLGKYKRKYTLTEIANKIGISHQQVSMREKRALKYLKQALEPYTQELLFS